MNEKAVNVLLKYPHVQFFICSPLAKGRALLPMCVCIVPLTVGILRRLYSVSHDILEVVARHINGRHRTLTIYRHAEPGRLAPKGR